MLRISLRCYLYNTISYHDDAILHMFSFEVFLSSFSIFRNLFLCKKMMHISDDKKSFWIKKISIFKIQAHPVAFWIFLLNLKLILIVMNFQSNERTDTLCLQLTIFWCQFVKVNFKSWKLCGLIADVPRSDLIWESLVDVAQRYLHHAWRWNGVALASRVLMPRLRVIKYLLWLIYCFI